MVLFDDGEHPDDFGLEPDEALLAREGTTRLGFVALTPEELDAFGQFDQRNQQRPSVRDTLWLPNATADYMGRVLSCGLEAMAERYRKPATRIVYWHFSRVCQQAIETLEARGLLGETPPTS